jgi:hypothetical protein
MTSLETRKQLLVTESELDRARLSEDWVTVKAEVRSLVEEAQPVISLMASAATVVKAFTVLSRTLANESSGRNNGRSSWLSRMLNGVQTGTALWQAIRSRRSSRT